jgi:6-phosphogluconate dehydrogenase (decarboxylating)
MDKIWESINALSEKMNGLSERSSLNGRDISFCQAGIEKANEDITDIAKILKEGNGTPSLLSRVSVIEAKLDNIIESIEKLTLSKEGKWTISVSIIFGVLGFITSVMYFITKLNS